MTMAKFKCSNEECGFTFNVDVDKCPFCGSPCMIIEQDKSSSESKVLVEGELPFPIEIVGYFGALYGAFATDGKIKLYKVILISLVEALIGVVLFILGMPLLKGGLEKVASFFFIIPGMVAVTHAFYSLVKYCSLIYLGRKKMSLSESSTRWIIFLIEFIVAAVFVAITTWIEKITPNVHDWLTSVLFMLGVGTLIGGIWSIIKYYIRRNKVNK